MPAPLEQQFATSVLRRVGAPVTPRSVGNLLGWMRAEGGHTHNDARFNFLNTTQPEPGAGNTGQQGDIKVYRNLGQGVDATVQTLRNGRYGGILDSFDAPAQRFVAAVNSSPWGTKRDFSSLITGAPVAPSSAGSPPAPGRPAGGPSAMAAAGGRQLTAGSLEEIRRYADQSRQDVLSGRAPAGIQTVLPKLRYGPGQAAAKVTTGLVGAPADPSAAQALNASKEQLGVPYVWGAGGPGGPTTAVGHGTRPLTGFDCSSLVQYAWAKAGVKLPRTTYDQIHVGQGIDASNRAAWHPGDLLFPSTGHVQLYLGNGMVREAPQTGGHVQDVKARSSYIAVRRPG